MMLVSMAKSCITKPILYNPLTQHFKWTFQWKCDLEDVQKKNKCCVHTGLAKVWPKNKACFTSNTTTSTTIATTKISAISTEMWLERCSEYHLQCCINTGLALVLPQNQVSFTSNMTTTTTTKIIIMGLKQKQTQPSPSLESNPLHEQLPKQLI